MLTLANIEHILAALPRLTIGVLGDLFLDRYLDLDATLTEKSVETGLDAYQVARIRSYPGAAGTIVNNLVALGTGRVVPVSIIGDDGEGFELRQVFDRTPSVDQIAVITAEGRRTPTYTKPMLCIPGLPPRELNRLDIKNRTPTPTEIEERLLDHLAARWSEFDAVIVLDQVSEEDCGVITDRIRGAIADYGQNYPHRFILADSRERIGLMRSVAIKPNLSEFLRAMNVSDSAGPTEWRRQLESLALRNGKPVFCTRGDQGILLAEPGEEVSLIPAYPVAGPIDIVGAGDSASAGIACAVAAGLSFRQAAAFGNLVASITIQQLGVTGVATPEQVRTRFQQVQSM